MFSFALAKIKESAINAVAICDIFRTIEKLAWLKPSIFLVFWQQIKPGTQHWHVKLV